MIKRIIQLLVAAIVIVVIGIVSIYYANPYGLETDNIRSRVFGFDIYQIPSKSMQPLLYPGDYITVSNLAYIEKSPKRNDVIVFRQTSKNNGEKKNHGEKKVQYIKRVVAIAGDRLELQNGKLMLNNHVVEERYVIASNNKTSYSQKMKLTTVPKNHVFVMGDNRDNSSDSRIYGTIAQNEIIAKASKILYGINKRSGKEIK